MKRAKTWPIGTQCEFSSALNCRRDVGSGARIKANYYRELWSFDAQIASNRKNEICLSTNMIMP